MKQFSSIYIIFILFISFFQLQCSSIIPYEPSEFVHTKGDKLYVGLDDQVIYLRGICFGNEVWSFTQVPADHHGEIDYQRVADMGMNTIRFYLNYISFEDDNRPFMYKQSGWDWLNQNIAWAEQYNIYLILNIHVPQGGFQSNGEGLALWDNPTNQDRLVALWKEIAKRYKNVKIIAGYDLLNEPVVSESVDQYKDLTQRIITKIRKEDKNHLIIIEKLLGVAEDWETYGDPSYTQFLISDSQHNVMYDFHSYAPIEYTHQNTSWTGLGEGGAYPDENIVVFPSDMIWAGEGGGSDNLLSGSTDWTLLSENAYQVNDSSFICAKPVLIAANTGSGTVYFDDFEVMEYDENGIFIRTLITHDIESDDGWGLWNADGSGTLDYSDVSVHSGSSSLYVTGTTGHSTCYLNELKFVPTIRHHYSVSGWVRGSNIPPNALCYIRFDFDKSQSGGEPMRRNREYLEYEINRWLAFGRQNGVPVNVGEFGLYRDCFENDKGGLSWVSDMLDILINKELNFTYHTYHEYSFGLYSNPSGLPDPNDANTPLIDLFTLILSR